MKNVLVAVGALASVAVFSSNAWGLILNEGRSRPPVYKPGPRYPSNRTGVFSFSTWATLPPTPTGVAEFLTLRQARTPTPTGVAAGTAPAACYSAWSAWSAALSAVSQRLRQARQKKLSQRPNRFVVPPMPSQSANRFVVPPMPSLQEPRWRWLSAQVTPPKPPNLRSFRGRLISPSRPLAPLGDENRFVPDEIIFEVRNTVPQSAVDDIARQNRLTRISSQRLELIGSTEFRYRIADGRQVPDVVRALEQDLRIASAQPNFIYRLAEDPARNSLSSTQYAVLKMHLPEAHRISTGQGVVVAVIDSGIDSANPETGRFDRRCLRRCRRGGEAPQARNRGRRHHWSTRQPHGRRPGSEAARHSCLRR